jgi:hypothetical protein
LVIRTHRGPDPEWFHIAELVNAGSGSISETITNKKILDGYGIHASETAWIGTRFDAVLNNDGSIDELYACVKNLVSDRSSSTLA